LLQRGADLRPLVRIGAANLQCRLGGGKNRLVVDPVALEALSQRVLDAIHLELDGSVRLDLHQVVRTALEVEPEVDALLRWKGEGEAQADDHGDQDELQEERILRHGSLPRAGVFPGDYSPGDD
jgi:hypothetical protein